MSTASNSSSSLILDTFRIDPQGVTLVPASSQTLPIAGDPVGAIGDPNGHGFAVLLNQDQGGTEPIPVLYTVTFDPASGLAELPSGGTNIAGTNAQSIHIGPRGTYMSLNFGQNSEFLTVYQLSTSNFQPLTSNTLSIGSVAFPFRGIFFDPTNTLIYIQSLNTNPASSDFTNFRVFELATLTELPSSPISFEQANEIACGLLNPYAPFVYCEHSVSAGGPPTGLSVFQVDPITGIPANRAPSARPFIPT